MQITHINKGKTLLAAMLILVIVQLFTIHLHFERVGQTHDVHVHSAFVLGHDLIEEELSGHGEEDDFDFVGWSAKQLSVFNLLAIFCFSLILPCLLQRYLSNVDVHRVRWQYRHYFFPYLRAPPSNS